MRHGKKFNHLSRSAAHRKALLMNLAKALILHKRIKTTVAKAKALRKFIAPLLTKAKKDTTHARRVVFSHFQDKEPVKELFNNIAGKIADRPGGYTRIIRLGNRLGDNAEMCLIELVDYNELLQKAAKSTKQKTRRSRRGGKAKTALDTPTPSTASESTPVAKEDSGHVVAPDPASSTTDETIVVANDDEASSNLISTPEPSALDEKTIATAAKEDNAATASATNAGNSDA